MQNQGGQALIPPSPASTTTEATLFNLRWAQIQSRQLDSSQPSLSLKPFLYAVLTTRIYCLPNCPSRKPRRSNVKFFDTRADAVRAGFRPCKRCKPDENESGQMVDEGKITVHKACLYLDQAADDAVAAKEGSSSGSDSNKSKESVKLAQVAEVVGLSPRYFHGLFKRVTGLTPAEYYNQALAKRGRRQQQQQAAQDDDNQVLSARTSDSVDRFDHVEPVWTTSVDQNLVDTSRPDSRSEFDDFLTLKNARPEDFDRWEKLMLEAYLQCQEMGIVSFPAPPHRDSGPNLDPGRSCHLSSRADVREADPDLLNHQSTTHHDSELFDPATYAKLENMFDRPDNELLETYDLDCTDMCFS